MPPITDGTFLSLKNYVAGAIGRSPSVDDEVSRNFGRWLNIAIQRIEEMVPLRYCYEEKILTPDVGDFEVEIPGLIPHHKVEIAGKFPTGEGTYPLEKRVFDSSRPDKNIPFSVRENERTGDPASYSFSQVKRLDFDEDLIVTLYPKVHTEGWKLYVHGYFYTRQKTWTDSTQHYLIAQEPAILQYSIAEQAFFFLEATNEKASPQHRRFLAEFTSTPKEGLAGLMYNESKAKELDGFRMRVTVPSDIGAGGEIVVGGNAELDDINSF